MNSLKSFFLWFLGIIFIACILLYGYTYLYKDSIANFSSIVSPLPEFFNSVFPKNASASDFWQPNTALESGATFSTTAVSALSYDISTNTLLYGKNMDSKLPIASLTKIMTAIIALEELDIATHVTVSKKAAEIGESSMGLSEGEQLTVEDLLYGLILHSANDAAETIAETSSMGRQGFIHLMNRRAEEMGLSQTRFTNPSGLQGDGEQYSTVKELLVITRYALQNPDFTKIASTYQYDIPQTPNHKAFTLFNETNLLTTYPGVKGVKTGFTDEAGMCLVTYLDYEGHQIIAILLNSENRRQEMKDLLDYSLLKLGMDPPPHN